MRDLVLRYLRKRKFKIRQLYSVLGWIFVLYLSVSLLVVPTGAEYKKNNPNSTALIDARVEQSSSKGTTPKRHQSWLPLSRISPNLRQAVIIGEDTSFYSHNGIDIPELKKVIRESLAQFKMPRGASTITQQLAKNLYLSESKNPLRKLREALIARNLENTLGKKRILEIYLNVIEWGDGIYGAEAAARYHLGKSASDLSPNEAAFLAAMIPNPLTTYNPKKHPRRVRARQHIILGRMTKRED